MSNSSNFPKLEGFVANENKNHGGNLNFKSIVAEANTNGLHNDAHLADVPAADLRQLFGFNYGQASRLVKLLNPEPSTTSSVVATAVGKVALQLPSNMTNEELVELFDPKAGSAQQNERAELNGRAKSRRFVVYGEDGQVNKFLTLKYLNELQSKGIERPRHHYDDGKFLTVLTVNESFVKEVVDVDPYGHDMSDGIAIATGIAWGQVLQCLRQLIAVAVHGRNINTTEKDQRDMFNAMKNFKTEEEGLQYFMQNISQSAVIKYRQQKEAGTLPATTRPVSATPAPVAVVVEVSRPTIDLSNRSKVIIALGRFSEPQFNQLVTLLGVNPSFLPGSTAGMATRAAELVRLMESPSGRGLAVLAHTMQEVLSS